MIKNLIFDFGNVLVNVDSHAVLKRYFKVDNGAEERFYAILTSPEFTEACDRGLISFDDLIKEAQAKNPHFADAFRFFRENYLDEVTGEIKGMKSILTGFKIKGFKLYGLSNWSSEVYDVMRKYEIFNLLDGQVLSCEEHVIKPEKEIYLRLCERYGLELSECIFIDDRAENVEGAKLAGMNAVLFVTPENMVTDVERLCQKH